MKVVIAIIDNPSTMFTETILIASKKFISTAVKSSIRNTELTVIHISDISKTPKYLEGKSNISNINRMTENTIEDFISLMNE
jgi:hypothetical protein